MRAAYMIVGTSYREGTDEVVRATQIGEPVLLEREPGNAYDPNAVKVFIRGIHVGYVRGTQAKALAADMDRRGESNRTGNYAIIGQLSHAQMEEGTMSGWFQFSIFYLVGAVVVGTLAVTSGAHATYKGRPFPFQPIVAFVFFGLFWPAVLVFNVFRTKGKPQ